MQQRTRIIVLVVLWTLMATVPAAAEVMDKEPTLSDIWQSAALWAVVALILGRLHPLLALVFLFLPATSAVRGSARKAHGVHGSLGRTRQAIGETKA